MRALLYGYNAFRSKAGKDYVKLSLLFESAGTVGFQAESVFCDASLCAIPLNPTMFNTPSGGFKAVEVAVDIDFRGRVCSVASPI